MEQASAGTEVLGMPFAQPVSRLLEDKLHQSERRPGEAPGPWAGGPPLCWPFQLP